MTKELLAIINESLGINDEFIGLLETMKDWEEERLQRVKAEVENLLTRFAELTKKPIEFSWYNGNETIECSILEYEIDESEVEGDSVGKAIIKLGDNEPEEYTIWNGFEPEAHYICLGTGTFDENNEEILEDILWTDLIGKKGSYQ